MSKRDPHSDKKLIDQAEEPATPSQSGASGGTMAKSIGQRDEEKTALGGDPEPTGVHKGDKANDGASAHPRDGTDLGGR